MAGYSLRQLHYFVATCEAGSIALAADREFVSSSAISAAIADLERTLGVALFVRRHAQGVAPTSQGRLLLAEARALLKQADDLERFGRELHSELAGHVHVGCLVTLAATLAPGALRSFCRANPNVSVELVDSGQDELVEGLRSGRLDLVITYDLDLQPGLAFERLRRLPPIALLPADHPLAGERSVSLRRLAPEPLVLLDLPVSREYFLGLFRSSRCQPMLGGRSAHLDVVCTLVGNGYGYSILNVPPANLRSADGSALTAVPVAGRPRALWMGFLQVAGGRPTRAVTALVDHCRAQLGLVSNPTGMVGPTRTGIQS